jgi:hypothetical protein
MKEIFDCSEKGKKWTPNCKELCKAHSTFPDGKTQYCKDRTGIGTLIEIRCQAFLRLLFQFVRGTHPDIKNPGRFRTGLIYSY